MNAKTISNVNMALKLVLDAEQAAKHSKTPCAESIRRALYECSEALATISVAVELAERAGILEKQ